MENLASLGHIVPELILGGSAVLLLLFAAAARREAAWQKTLFPFLSLLGLGVAMLVLLGLKPISSLNCPSDGCQLFYGLLASDPMATFFRALIMAATLVGVILAIGSPSLPTDRRGEYHALLLIMAMGMCLLAASNHLLMIFVAMETVSLCSYLLTGWDSGKQRSREAGLKYVLYGGVASGIMLFGMSMFYGLFGDLSLQGLHAAMGDSAVLAETSGQWAATLSIVFILGGLGYKVAAVPFHMWCPDVYEGAPTPFTALLSVAPKAAGFAVMLRFFWGIFLEPGSQEQVLDLGQEVPWMLILGVVSVLTMTLGNLAAIMQNNLKRLLAYSSIAHAGYLLMGVTAGGSQGFEAVTLYLAIYLVMNMGAFAVVSSVDRSLGSENIRAYRGLGKRAPLLGVVMAIFLFSLTGLPPTAGFIGKLYLFAALIHKGSYWFYALAVVGVLNSVVSLYYYARVLKVMYLEKTPDEPKLSIANPATAVATVLAVPVLLFGILWHPLALMASWSAKLFH